MNDVFDIDCLQACLDALNRMYNTDGNIFILRVDLSTYVTSNDDPSGYDYERTFDIKSLTDILGIFPEGRGLQGWRRLRLRQRRWLQGRRRLRRPLRVQWIWPLQPRSSLHLRARPLVILLVDSAARPSSSLGILSTTTRPQPGSQDSRSSSRRLYGYSQKAHTTSLFPCCLPLNLSLSKLLNYTLPLWPCSLTNLNHDPLSLRVYATSRFLFTLPHHSCSCPHHSCSCPHQPWSCSLGTPFVLPQHSQFCTFTILSIINASKYSEHLTT